MCVLRLRGAVLIESLCLLKRLGLFGAGRPCINPLPGRHPLFHFFNHVLDRETSESAETVWPSLISKGTIIRTGVLLLALLNQVLTLLGYCPLGIADGQIETLVSTLWTIGAAVWGFWKNNSFTKEAIESDKVLQTLKKKKSL